DDDPSATLKTPAIAVPASIPPRPVPRAGASPSSATTTPVRPATSSQPPRAAQFAPPTPASSASPSNRAAAPPQAPRVPAPPILPAAPPPVPTRLDTDAGDEATTVEPPLFPMSEPVVDARPPEEVYVPPPPHTGETDLPMLKRWGLVGAVLLIPIAIGLLAYALRDEPPSRPVPAAFEH
ncbi:MAG TPA: hypothetical protein VFQ65_10475, partial [Kofleriaceae bacterium]|nr:hypothetical protein [Kofleriaceae bacterium]